MKKPLCLLLSLSMLFNLFAITKAKAVSIGAVVINEIAWMGTTEEANDEWLELYNTTDQEIDLTGFYVEDDDATKYTISSGKIAAYGYFLIEDSEETISSIKADAVINMSLSNSGDKLVLKEAAGQIIDTVNSASGAWFSGNNTDKTTMERLNALNSGDDAKNWANNTAGNGATGRTGNIIKGTPRSINSVSQPPQDKALAQLTTSNSSPNKGATVTITSAVSNVKNLFAYGFNISYDTKVLQYQTATVGAFLSANQTVATSFQAGLQDGKPGMLIVGEARTVDSKQGVTGGGNLFSATFKVIGEAGSSAQFKIETDSFLSDPDKDIAADFKGTSLTVGTGTFVEPVINLKAAKATDRYSLQLTFEAPASGAEEYHVFRKNSAGSFVEIGVTKNLNYIDGKELIPGVSYAYQVIAVKNGEESTAQTVNQTDDRGLLGDNNRSDRVDGRDLEQLARHFAESATDSHFAPLVDTTYDGKIDGKDLLDMAAHWALNYAE